jgi:dihydroneopterin aldolase
LNDSIRITGLELFGYHGVYDHEKQNGQRFLVDLAVWIDTDNASVSDDLSQTLDYGELVKVVAAEVQGESVDLIEKLAAKVLDVVWRFEEALAAEVTVHKPEAPVGFPVTDISVTLKRERPKS